MTILEEVKFLIEGYELHKSSKQKGEYKTKVKKLYLSKGISEETWDIAQQLFPTKKEIADEAMSLLSTTAEEDDDDYSGGNCGSTPRPRRKVAVYRVSSGGCSSASSSSSC